MLTFLDYGASISITDTVKSEPSFIKTGYIITSSDKDVNVYRKLLQTIFLR